MPSVLVLNAGSSSLKYQLVQVGTRDVLAVGLVGLSQVGAQFWLDSDQRVPRDEAVALMTSLAWRGIGGFPKLTDSPDQRPEQQRTDLH